MIYENKKIEALASEVTGNTHRNTAWEKPISRVFESVYLQV